MRYGGDVLYGNSNQDRFQYQCTCILCSRYGGSRILPLLERQEIRPDAIGDRSITSILKKHTQSLVLQEGVTHSYYGKISSLPSWNSQHRISYLEELGNAISSFRRNPNRLKVSAEESSYRVWEADVTSFGFGGLSYYDKGN
jgi:predicted metalloprotease with PDZ domain